MIEVWMKSLMFGWYNLQYATLVSSASVSSCKKQTEKKQETENDVWWGLRHRPTMAQYQQASI